MFFAKNKEKNPQKNIIVISKDLKRLGLISDHLTVRGLSVITYQTPLKDFAHTLKQEELEAVVVDLAESENHQDDIDFISQIFPASVVRIALADKDSIATKQSFLDRGIGYLHFQTQFQQLFSEINHLKTHLSRPAPICIGVLGTKGGIGNSFLSYHIAKNIFDRFKTKTLLIQGAYSSFNLDLLSNREFEEKDFRENDVCLLREKKEDLGDLGHLGHLQQPFNFVLHDQSVQSMSKDELEQILNFSDCIVLLLSHDLSSIRKAKEILSINDFLLSVEQGSKKIILALNESSLNKALTKEEIEGIIGKKIHCIIPRNYHKAELKSTLKAKTKKAIETLVSKIIGSHSKQKSGIKGFWRGWL